MQLLLILGIVVAIAAVAFALQNNTPVTVALGIWNFESSLAMVLLIALGIGAVIAVSLSWPGMIKGFWTSSRLRRQVNQLQDDKAMLEQRVVQLEEELKRVSPEPIPEEPPRYLGLKSILIGGGKAENPKE
ncbi:MAG TPA: lipopolysaccharide assembly protein LapA domain-containing protein [Nitrosospira sp.]